MTRNRFFELKSFLHAADNHSLSDSQMAKVEPLYNLLNQKLQAYGIFHEGLSINESMVSYYGHHSCKQFIRTELITFSYKLWALASATGLPYSIEIYAERSANDTGEQLGTRVVKNDHILIRPVIRGKKWYWPLVINALNIGFVYSW